MVDFEDGSGDVPLVIELVLLVFKLVTVAEGEMDGIGVTVVEVDRVEISVIVVEGETEGVDVTVIEVDREAIGVTDVEVEMEGVDVTDVLDETEGELDGVRVVLMQI